MSGFCPNALHTSTYEIRGFHPSPAFAFNCPEIENFGVWRWLQTWTDRSSGPSVVTNCVKWCRLLTAPSTKWNSAVNFRGASPSHLAASSGTWQRSKLGWLRADQPQLFERNLLTSGSDDRALFESRVGFKQRHRRRDEYRGTLLPSDPGVDDVRPLLHHMAALNFVFCLVVDAA